jgi:hypothetical protein
VGEWATLVGRGSRKTDGLLRSRLISEELEGLLGRYAAEPLLCSEFSEHSNERLGATGGLVCLCGVETG